MASYHEQESSFEECIVMSDAAKIIMDQALELSPSDRAELASTLVASLDGPADSRLSEAWGVEICQRIEKIENDPDLLLDTGKVLARARARIQRE